MSLTKLGDKKWGKIVDEKLIFELEETEKKNWKGTIKKVRDKVVKRPIDYVTLATDKMKINRADFEKSISGTILRIRDMAWSFYIEDEALFHREALSNLVLQKGLPNSILKYSIKSIIGQDELIQINLDEFESSIAEVVGDFTGRIMPYIYELSLSTTNSRRSRSGTTFEEIIYYTMGVLNYPFVNQSHLGKKFFEENNLGKKVDMIVPSKEAYIKNRSKCQIVTMKTSLRERWQEVVEEINRTNIPHIYLLTLDELLTANVMNVLQNHNITIVTYQSIKDKLADYDNIMSFEEYFHKDLPHVLDYWK